MSPGTLAEVAALTACGDSFDRSLANFLDEFYSAPSEDALAGEPELLAPRFADLGRIQDAYLAATAEELTRQFNLPPSAWINAGRENCTDPGLRPLWLRCALFCCWRARPVSAHETCS